MNKYQELTINGLKEGLKKQWDFMDSLSTGFFISDDDTNPEDCVLTIGLNPAGDSKNADDERNQRLYLFSVDDDLAIHRYAEEKQGRIVNNGYYRKIMKIVDHTVGKGRWPWSKESWAVLEKQIDSDALLNHNKLNIKKQYDRDQKRKITVYHGDMFYVHKTDSTEIEMKKNWDGVEYCKKMLSYHIDDLKAHNKSIKYVYIPNKKISNWLAVGKEYVMLDDGTYIFLSEQPTTSWWNRHQRDVKDPETINRILNHVL